MSELVCLELGILLWIVHVLVQAAFAGSALNPEYLVGPRDQFLQPKGALYPRAPRAWRIHVELFSVFRAGDLVLLATQHRGGGRAAVWISGRIIYIPLYIF